MVTGLFICVLFVDVFGGFRFWILFGGVVTVNLEWVSLLVCLLVLILFCCVLCLVFCGLRFVVFICVAFDCLG